MSGPSAGSMRGSVISGLVFAVGGLLLTGGGLLAMHGVFTPPEAEDAGTAVTFDAPPPKPPPTRPKPKPKPKPRRTSRTPPPMPSLASTLAGLSFGLPGLSGGLDDTTDALLGDVGDVVMTEDAVDVPPRATTRVAAEYPPRARGRNVTGYVTVSMLVGADGSVRDLRVLEAEPPGIFDDVAVQALRQWRFQPAMYEGRPVSMRARQTIRFELE